MSDAVLSLGALYAKDPNDYSDQDLQTVVHTLRSSYHQFRAGDLKAGKSPKAKLSENQEEAINRTGMSAEDLLGDL